MALDATELREDLRAYREKHGHGSFAALSRKTNPPVTEASLSRLAKGQPTTTFETWLSLHKAEPAYIRPPKGMEKYSVDTAVGPMPSVSGMVRIPVFRAGAGPNKFWTDGQRQPGDADQFVMVPAHDVDENTFGVVCKGDSMSPTCDDGDIAIVVPSEEPAHGKVCFATWPEDDGARMVRRFYKYGDSVVLRPDNPQAGEEITLDDSNGHGVRIYRVVAIYKKRP